MRIKYTIFFYDLILNLINNSNIVVDAAALFPIISTSKWLTVVRVRIAKTEAANGTGKNSTQLENNPEVVFK